MSIAATFLRLRSSAARFGRAKDGNIAVIFSIALVPIIGLVGAAVDYSRANNARTAMQAALDSAALMVAKDINSGKITASEASTKAVTYFNSLYTNTEAAISVTTTYTPKSGSTNANLIIKGSGKIKTELMNVVGIPEMEIGASSTTTWGGTRLRVALALDVTGSMGQSGKLAALQKAAKKLIDTLKIQASTKDDVYISIIPFNRVVNVGTDNKDATWLSFTWDGYGTCSNSSKNYNTKTTCEAAGKTWTASKKSDWDGCVTDRDFLHVSDYDTKKDVPSTGTPATLFLAKNDSGCPVSMLPLKSAYEATEGDNSSDVTTLKGKINSFVANSNTNQSIGLQWAWMSLQQTSPLNAPAKDAQYKYTDAIVLMSDGLNTENQWSTDENAIDVREKMLCTNIKKPKDGVAETVLYTIQVNTSGDAESKVLKDCGSDSGGFYSTTTADGIANIFEQVGASLSKLRVAK